MIVHCVYCNDSFYDFFSSNTVRQTKSAALLATDETGNNNTFLGKPGKDFSFGDIKPFRVEFVECSALGSDGTPQINDVESWLQKIA